MTHVQDLYHSSDSPAMDAQYPKVNYLIIYNHSFGTYFRKENEGKKKDMQLMIFS